MRAPCRLGYCSTQWPGRSTSLVTRHLTSRHGGKLTSAHSVPPSRPIKPRTGCFKFGNYSERLGAGPPVQVDHTQVVTVPRLSSSSRCPVGILTEGHLLQAHYQDPSTTLRSTMCPPRISDCQQMARKRTAPQPFAPAARCVPPPQSCGRDKMGTLRNLQTVESSAIGGMMLYCCRRCIASCAHKAAGKVMLLDGDVPSHPDVKRS